MSEPKSMVTCITLHVETDLEEIEGGYRFNVKDIQMLHDSIMTKGKIPEDQIAAVSAGVKLVILSTAHSEWERVMKKKMDATAVEVSGDGAGKVNLN